MSARKTGNMDTKGHPDPGDNILESTAPFHSNLSQYTLAKPR